MSITFDIVPENEVPIPKSGPRAKGGSPIDSSLAAFLRDHPGQWVEYPVSEFWDDKDPSDKHDLRVLATRVSGKFGVGRSTAARKKHGGAYAASDGERFCTRIDHDRHRVLVSFTREDI